MPRSRAATRRDRRLLVACLGSVLAAACSAGETPRSADRVAPRTGPTATVAADFRPDRLTGAILRDADLEGVPVLQERPGFSTPFPSPDGDRELAITFGERRRDVLRAALDATSVLDDALPPAAPLPAHP